MIKSVYETQDEILNAINELHLDGKGYQCDITYGNGGFWKNIQAPALKFDITPLKDGVVAATSTALPLLDKSLDNIVFDPPFITYVKKGRDHNSVIAKRFGGYETFDDLLTHYTQTLQETVRVLKRKGKLIFKCQDIVHNHQLRAVHAQVIMLAELVGFRLLDSFVLVAKHRMPVKTCMNSNNWKQRHARVFHSYFIVLEKI